MFQKNLVNNSDSNASAQLAGPSSFVSMTHPTFAILDYLFTNDLSYHIALPYIPHISPLSAGWRYALKRDLAPNKAKYVRFQGRWTLLPVEIIMPRGFLTSVSWRTQGQKQVRRVTPSYWRECANIHTFQCCIV